MLNILRFVERSNGNTGCRLITHVEAVGNVGRGRICMIMGFKMGFKR